MAVVQPAMPVRPTPTPDYETTNGTECCDCLGVELLGLLPQKSLWIQALLGQVSEYRTKPLFNQQITSW